MKKATLKQAEKILSIFKDTPAEQVQEILKSGLLADLRDGNIASVNRREFREVLGLKVFLKFISAGENLVIDACDGSKILADAGDVFSWIASDFKNWGADELGVSTAETPADVYEIENDGTFVQIFGSLNSDLGKLCLTQHQIKKFVKKYRGWLRTYGFATFFLFKSLGNFFVARVRFSSVDSLSVYINWLEYDAHVWDARGRHRIVVPRLA